jgi:T5orf172 domain
VLGRFLAIRCDTGPVQPSADVRAELVALLETDESRLGEVYRGLQRGLDAASIAAELEIGSSNFVWNYERAAKALLDGNLPTAPTVALQVARKFRSILKSAQLTPAARACLETNLRELERRANDETARVAEVRHAQEQTQAAEARNDTGIYVYALPHYLRYPFEPDSGRTLMKVGRSDRDIIQRFRSQTRTTALPEEPILLRIYRTDRASAALTEADFHRLLNAADHNRSVTRTAGREWFVTSTRFLDEIARVPKLPVVIVNDADVLDED